LTFLGIAEKSAVRNEFNDAMLDIYSVKSDIFKDLSDFRHAYKYQQLHVELKDSLKELNNFSRISELNARYESEKREKEIAEKEVMLAEQEASEKSQQMIFVIVVICIALILVLVSYSLIKKKKINRVLNEQNEEINEQRTKILSSINYAKKIQNSILLPEEQIQKFLPNSFVYFKPKDIVSGDFYWFSKLGSRYIIATIDCTGHGVPGAFMSLIANSKLNKVVNEKGIHDPGKILTEVHKEIISSLNQEAHKNNAQDGMDMSLCIIDPTNMKIQFAGAQNPIYLVKDQQAKEIKGDGFSIGGSFFINHSSSDFTTKEISYEEGTYLYMFTDGYIDQFGGEDNKKMNKKRFKELLLHTSHNGLTNAKTHIENTFHQWRGLNPQIDDVLIIGTKL
jgi:serine phosphatase RsbU (regulator of sigma subunit)